MRVLAIDPGYDRLGVAILDGDSHKQILVKSLCITTPATAPFTDRLAVAGNHFSLLLSEYKPSLVAVETLFFNQNVKTALNVAQMRGILIFLAHQAGCEILEFSPQNIKLAVTGYGGSDKKAVKAMLQRLLTAVPKDALDDEYDAIAVGVTCLSQYRAQALS